MRAPSKEACSTRELSVEGEARAVRRAGACETDANRVKHAEKGADDNRKWDTGRVPRSKRQDHPRPRAIRMQ